MNKVDLVLIVCCIFVLGVAGYLGYYKMFIAEPADSKGIVAKPSPRVAGVANKIQPTVAKHILDKDIALFAQLETDSKATGFGLYDIIGSNTYGNGHFYRGGGKLYLGIKLFMPDPPEDHIHQVWLMKEYPRKQYVPLGRPQILGTGEFLVAKTITPDYEGFNKVIVTLEKTEDMNPERVVMEGILEK